MFRLERTASSWSNVSFRQLSPETPFKLAVGLAGALPLSTPGDEVEQSAQNRHITYLTVMMVPGFRRYSSSSLSSGASVALSNSMR
jgi:hypothetical protein